MNEYTIIQGTGTTKCVYICIYGANIFLHTQTQIGRIQAW